VADFTLILGNKAYSSWSLRGWLLLKLTGAVFDEVVVPLDRPETKAAIRAHSPSGRVPTLKAGGLAAEGLAVWDTLAIAEYLHERFPEAGLWPEDPAARACARSVAAEMHAGFPVLRARLPMDLKREPPEPGAGIAVEGALADEIARIVAIWSDCRARSGSAGDFLFGRFGVADAFYAPVATRFVTYGVTLEGAAADYRDALVAWPDLRDWIAAAKVEPWIIEEP
jgi:glutathione S-transferase